jgi:hypothetical protein
MPLSAPGRDWYPIPKAQPLKRVPGGIAPHGKAKVNISAGFPHGSRCAERGAGDRIGAMHSKGHFHADVPTWRGDDSLARSRGGDIPIQLYGRRCAERAPHNSHLVHRVGSRVYLGGDPTAGARLASVALKNGTSMLRVGVRNWRVTSFLFSSARYTWPFCKNTQIGSRLPTGRCVSTSNTSALSDGFLELTAEPACTPVGAVSV